MSDFQILVQTFLVSIASMVPLIGGYWIGNKVKLAINKALKNRNKESQP